MHSFFTRISSLILLALFLQSFLAVYAQDSIELRHILKDENYCDLSDDYVNSYTDRQLISNYTMNRLLRKDLSLITLNEKGLPSIGNYATLDLKEASSRANLHVSIYNLFGAKGEGRPIKSILSLNVDAGLNEGISSLFTNKNLNNQAGITAKWSILSRRTKYVSKSSLDCNALKLMRERLLLGFQQEQELYDLRKLKLEWDVKNDCDEMIAKAENYRKKIALLKESIKNVNYKADSCNTIQELEKTILEYNTHLRNSRNIQNERAIYNPSNTELVSKYWKGRVKLYLDSLISLESSQVKFDHFTIQWWDIDASLNGEKYNLLDASLSVDKQLTKKSFNRWAVGFTFNRFSSEGNNWITKHGLLFKGGYNIGNDNSLGGASLLEVTTTETTVNAGNVERKAVGKVNAYTTPFVRSFSHNVNIQLSKYLNEEKSKAFSFRLNASAPFDEMKNFLKLETPEITPEIGYFLTLINQNDNKGVVNFEVFINFNDILNSNNSNTKFYERHQLGLRFGVPFRSIFLND